MIFGTPYAAVPFGHSEYSAEATIGDYETLLTQPDAARHFLLKISPYDPDTTAVVDRYFSQGPSIVPGSSQLWYSRIVDALNLQVQLFGGRFGIGGEGRPSFGAITLAFGDAGPSQDDELATFEYDGRTVELKMGGDGFHYDDYQTVFKGTAEDATWDEDTFSLVLRDPSFKIEKAVQSTLYAGTGGAEGGEDLTGKPKPLSYGRPPNLTPVLVDRTYLVYQFHESTATAVDYVYDRGDAYAAEGDTASYAALIAASVSASSYKTCLAQGMFRLGSTPNGIVTCSVQGDTESGTLHETAGAICKRILKNKAGLSDSDLNLPSFTALDTSQPYALSLYIAESASVPEVLDTILSPRGFRTFTRDGKISVGRVAFGTRQLTIQAPDIVDISRERTDRPAWRVNLGYNPNWTLMRPDELAAVSLDLDADFATNAVRRVTDSNSAILTRRALARDLEVDTLFNDLDDATDEASDLLDLIGEDRHIYRVQVLRRQFVISPGATVLLKHSRFGLSTGRDMIVLGITETIRTGITELRLWG